MKLLSEATMEVNGSKLTPMEVGRRFHGSWSKLSFMKIGGSFHGSWLTSMEVGGTFHGSRWKLGNELKNQMVWKTAMMRRTQTSRSTSPRTLWCKGNARCFRSLKLFHPALKPFYEDSIRQQLSVRDLAWDCRVIRWTQRASNYFPTLLRIQKSKSELPITYDSYNKWRRMYNIKVVNILGKIKGAYCSCHSEPGGGSFPGRPTETTSHSLHYVTRVCAF